MSNPLNRLSRMSTQDGIKATILAFFLAFIYGLQFADEMRAGKVILICVVAGAIVAVLWIFIYINAGLVRPILKGRPLAAFELTAFILMIVVLMIPAIAFALGGVEWVLDEMSRPSASAERLELAAAAATLVAGGVLFAVRLKLRMCYGVTEALVGVFVAVKLARSSALTPPSIDLTFLLGFMTASVYLVVRGFDNVHQGMTKTPVDLLWAFLQTKRRAAIGNSSGNDSPQQRSQNNSNRY